MVNTISNRRAATQIKYKQKKLKATRDEASACMNLFHDYGLKISSFLKSDYVRMYLPCEIQMHILNIYDNEIRSRMHTVLFKELRFFSKKRDLLHVEQQ